MCFDRESSRTHNRRRHRMKPNSSKKETPSHRTEDVSISYYVCAVLGNYGRYISCCRRAVQLAILFVFAVGGGNACVLLSTFLRFALR